MSRFLSLCIYDFTEVYRKVNTVNQIFHSLLYSSRDKKKLAILRYRAIEYHADEVKGIYICTYVCTLLLDIFLFYGTLQTTN